MLYRILRQGVRRSATDQAGVTPGGVLVYGDEGEDVATIPFGRSHFGPEEDVFDVTADTVYDLASLTKPIATAAVLMKLDLDLDAPVRPHVPELGKAGAHITFAHLLGHASGLPAHRCFYERLRGARSGARSRRTTLLKMAAGAKLEAAPGTRSVYSDLGYIVLGFAIERITGQRLDEVVRALVTEPLEMNSTFFVDLGRPAQAKRVRADRRIAPTEQCPYRGLVVGEVHDDNAHAGGGIFGHAGLFAPAGDVARFARALTLTAAGDAIGGFQPEVVRRFFSTASAPDTTWRLGWDTPSPVPGVSHAGVAWPRDGVGHLGFTGTSMWLDPSRGRYVVLLTNRVHPSREQTGIRELRCAIMDAVVHQLERRRASTQ
ncbi:serine hydrolase domain-containing protein [Haliangium sp.]|uniref:serine hydrolase domain-containing protein n=1 Tax=Haliangium sp. TaxID=2663208 RepID=UPI003D0B750C